MRTEALVEVSSTFPSVSNEGTEERPAPSHNSLRPNTDITQDAAGLFSLLFSSLESSFLSNVLFLFLHLRQHRTTTEGELSS